LARCSTAKFGPQILKKQSALWSACPLGGSELAFKHSGAVDASWMIDRGSAVMTRADGVMQGCMRMRWKLHPQPNVKENCCDVIRIKTLDQAPANAVGMPS
jgi:hypothetical protein